ncbi:MAG: MOSC domain-containing protein [Anaerolineae bacterium]|nr:MOSC domain-containing protein [Anaerolineae bacterium]
MHLLSVNVGIERTIQKGNKSEATGIYKIPTAAPVAVGVEGLVGDVISNKKHHGGPDQAVYIYGGRDYAWWAEALGESLAPGTFGENLTISDLESAPVCIGDRLQVGEALLEITGPRIPCAKLAARMGDPQFVKRFKEAERPGLYCRVIRTGNVCAGDPVTVVRAQTGPDAVTIREAFRSFYKKGGTVAEMRRMLNAPIDIRARNAYTEWLAAAQGE